MGALDVAVGTLVALSCTAIDMLDVAVDTLVVLLHVAIDALDEQQIGISI